jgi:chromosome partitioning protein
MAEIICVIGNKGGTGKTTLSHMLCQGLGLLGQRAACVLTDTSREPLDTRRTALRAGRRAHTRLADQGGRQASRTLENWIGVIDGGGNRTEMDRKLYALSDLVLLPFRDSHEDIRTVLQDLERSRAPTRSPRSGPPTPGSRH